MRWNSLWTLGLLVSSTWACGESPVALDRDQEAPVQTQALSYDLAVYFLDAGGAFVRSDTIEYQYRNPTDNLREVLFCITPSVALERLSRDGTWVVVWEALDPRRDVGCEGPLQIGPGETFSAATVIQGGTPGTNTYPVYSADEFGGIYRLVLRRVFDGSIEVSGGEVTSNRFILTPESRDPP